MKDVINKILYDTDKANELCTINIDGGMQETYYKTKNGSIFCYQKWGHESDGGRGGYHGTRMFPVVNEQFKVNILMTNSPMLITQYFPNEITEA